MTKLDATGSGLVYSTYLGGSDGDVGLGIAVDGAGSAYVTGDTVSTDFPTTAGAAQTTNAGGYDAFVTKLDATGSGLVYSTYLGGSDGDFGLGIAVDGAGSAYVTGDTVSTDFPTTAGAAQTTLAGGFRRFCCQDRDAPHVNGPVQERRLEDLWRVQEPRRLRELCCEQGQEPAFRAVARISGAARAAGPEGS